MKSAVLLAGLYARGCRDDRRRAAPDPRSHRADARARGRARPAWAEERLRSGPRTGSRSARSRFRATSRRRRRCSSPPRSSPAPTSPCTASASTPVGPGSSTSSSAWARESPSTTAARSAASRRATSRFRRRSSSGRTVSEAEVPSLVDELPLFAVAASHARGESVVHGASELRVEGVRPDRAVVEELRRIGAHIRATPDGFHVRGVPARLRGGVVDSRGDHRLAMLGAVAGVVLPRGRRASRSGGGRDELSGLLRGARAAQRLPGGLMDRNRGMIVAIDGPAGSGKSTVAITLARRLGLPPPRHGRDVPGADVARAARRRAARRRRRTRGARARATRSPFGRTGRSRSQGPTSPKRSAKPRSTSRCRPSPGTPRFGR